MVICKLTDYGIVLEYDTLYEAQKDVSRKEAECDDFGLAFDLHKLKKHLLERTNFELDDDGNLIFEVK